MGGGIKLNDNAFLLLLGDCRETLKPIPDFGLRDYGDRRLSWAARGLLVYLLGKPDSLVSIQELTAGPAFVEGAA